jgi:hypothetical protein
LFELLAMLCLFAVQRFLTESMAFLDLEQMSAVLITSSARSEAISENRTLPVVLLFVRFLQRFALSFRDLCFLLLFGAEVSLSCSC